jgi:hypothetical protein
MMKQFLSKGNNLLEKKKCKILNILYIHFTFMIYQITFFIFLSYYVFDEYSLVLVLNRMSKRLKSVTKKLFREKSRAGMVEVMKHMDPSLVGALICSQRDKVIFLFSYHFLI